MDYQSSSLALRTHSPARRDSERVPARTDCPIPTSFKESNHRLGDEMSQSSSIVPVTSTQNDCSGFLVYLYDNLYTTYSNILHII